MRALWVPMRFQTLRAQGSSHNNAPNPRPLMNSDFADGSKLILRIIALLCAGFLGFYFLTRWGAPAYDQAAIFVGLLLTSFGMALGKFAMELVVLPLGVLRMVQRIFQGRKPVLINTGRRDPLDVFGRLLFVSAYTVIAGVVGAVAGLAAGGAGTLATGAAFATLGGLLAVLVPNEVLWSTEGDEGGEGLSDQQRAEMEAGREAGDPTVLFTDRVVKEIREKFIEDQGKR